MNIAQLRTFLTLAKTLSYTETARALFISQPAVTQQVSKLEAEVGVRLFARSTRGVALTAAGKAYYEDCVDVVSRLDAAAARARVQADRTGARLRIGCASLAFLLRLDALVKRLRTPAPDCDIRLVQDDPESLIGDLCREELDAVFAARPTRPLPSGVVFTKLFDSRFVCIVPQGSTLAARESVSIADLDGSTLVLLEDGRCPTEMRDAQSTVTLDAPHSPVVYNSHEFIGATLVAGGAGVAVMPDFVCPTVDGIVRIPVDDFDPLPFGVFTRAGDTSEATRQLVEISKLLYGREARMA